MALSLQGNIKYHMKSIQNLFLFRDALVGGGGGAEQGITEFLCEVLQRACFPITMLLYSKIIKWSTFKQWYLQIFN
jgi:hypothetical protein